MKREIVAATTSEASVDAAAAGRRPPRRRVWPVVLVLAAAVVLLAVDAFMALEAAEDHLRAGRAAAIRGRNELVAGDADAAAASFREARAAFERADERTRGPGMRAMGWLPIVGRTADAVDAITESAVLTSDGTILLADAASRIPGGPIGLAPTGGEVPLDRIPPLARAASEADELIADAAALLNEAPSTLLLGPVGGTRRDAEDAVTELREAVHAASLLLEGLPEFLGGDRPRRYFFGAQNPAELRGTGGLIGAYSILTIHQGAFGFSPFEPIHSLSRVELDSIAAPNEDYENNYNQFRRGDWFWTSINVMPDFPSVAKAIITSFQAATGDRLDGVILADPFALAALLEATGPVPLPGYDVEIGADNVVSFTTHDAYSVFTDQVRRKRVLGDVARAAFERFIDQPSVDRTDLEKLLGATAARHIQIYSRDPTMQQGLVATPAGGSLVPPGAAGDLVSVVVNSAAGSKVDYYQDRTIRYAVDLRDDRSSDAALELSLHNRAPSSGQPAYVIGPFEPTAPDVGPILRTLEAGESVALVNVYCGTDCLPGETTLGAEPIEGAFRDDLGVRYFQRYFSVESREHRVLSLSWRDPAAWDGNTSGGVYRATFTTQATIRPATLRLSVEPPEGMEIVRVEPPLTVVDGAAVYEGNPGSRLDVIVEFRPPLAVRLARNVMRFLTTPVLEL